MSCEFVCENGEVRAESSCESMHSVCGDDTRDVRKHSRCVGVVDAKEDSVVRIDDAVRLRRSVGLDEKRKCRPQQRRDVDRSSGSDVVNEGREYVLVVRETVRARRRNGAHQG